MLDGTGMEMERNLEACDGVKWRMRLPLMTMGRGTWSMRRVRERHTSAKIRQVLLGKGVYPGFPVLSVYSRKRSTKVEAVVIVVTHCY